MDRLGDAKDQVRDQDQALLLKIMDQAANPQVISHLLCSILLSVISFHIYIKFMHLFIPVRVGADDGGLQTQEQQDQRGSLPLSHFNLKRVSATSSICRLSICAICPYWICFFFHLLLTGLDLRVWRSVKSSLTSVTSSGTPQVRYDTVSAFFLPLVDKYKHHNYSPAAIPFKKNSLLHSICK